MENRRSELLDTQYFHVVFTLPEQIAPIAYQNKKVVYGILFRAAAETLRTIAADPKHLGAEIGFFAVLHTWGQNLLHHPHLHCVVAGGGLSPDGTQWISCRPGFFLPVRVLSRLFRRLFLEYLISTFDAGRLEFFSSLEPLRERRAFLQHLAPTRETEWVVYAKRPFAGPEQVLDYGDTKQLNEQLKAINCVELGYSSRLDESCGDGCGVPPSARPRWKCRFHIRWCPALL